LASLAKPGEDLPIPTPSIPILSPYSGYISI